MLFILTRLQQTLRQGIINQATSRHLSRGTVLFDEEEQDDENVKDEEEKYIDPAKDRRNLIPWETSIRYLASDAYKQTYGDQPVWKPYRRNYKGQFPPAKTRKMCIRQGVISTGSPCPICRDEYLVFDHRNVALLKQFISEYNGAVLSYEITNICQRQHQNLLVALHRAKNFGTITFDVPFRKYNYSDWYKPEKATEVNK